MEYEDGVTTAPESDIATEGGEEAQELHYAIINNPAAVLQHACAHVDAQVFDMGRDGNLFVKLAKEVPSLACIKSTLRC